MIYKLCRNNSVSLNEGIKHMLLDMCPRKNTTGNKLMKCFKSFYIDYEFYFVH